MPFDDQALFGPREDEEEEIDYGMILDEQREAQKTLVKETMRAQEKVNPEQRAEAVRLSGVYKVPVEVVERNLDTFRAQERADFPEYEDLIDRAPKLAKWIVQHSAEAAAGKDDLPALIQLEHDLTFGGHILRGVDDNMAMWGRFMEWAGEATGRADLTKQGRGIALYYNLQSGLRGQRSLTRHDVKDVPSLLHYLKGIVGEQIPMMAPAMAAGWAVGGASTIAATTLGLGAKVVTWAPRIGSFIGALGVNWPRSIGEVQQQLKETDPDAVATAEVFLGGSAIAAFDSASETKIGLGLTRLFGRPTAEQIVKRVLLAPVKPQFVRRTVNGAVSGFAVEGLTEAFQEAIGAVAAAQGADVSVDWTQTVDAMIEAGLQGAIVGGGMGASVNALTYHNERARWAAAVQQEDFFNALASAAKDSTLLKRLPEAFQSFVEAETKDGPISTIYAPTETFITYWQDQNVSPELVAAELTGNPKALQEAIDTAADLAIPTSVYATKIAPTEHHAFFAREIKLDPRMMNARQAAEVRAAFDEVSRTFAEAMEGAPAKPTTEIGIRLAQQLMADPRSQAMAAEYGVDPQELAETYAAQVEAAFVTLGERIGEDPLKHYARYRLNIGPSGPSVPWTGGPAPAPGAAPAAGPGAAAPSAAAPGAAPAEGAPAAEGAAPAGEEEGPELAYEQPPGVPLPHLTTAPAEVKRGRLLVSTRRPSAVKAPAAGARLRTDWEAVQQGATLVRRFAAVLRHYGVLTVDESRSGTAAEVLERLITRMVDNLRWLYEQVPAAIRERSRLWYVGAHRIAQDLADEFDLRDEQAAAILAVLSPNREWYTNVTMAERVMRWYRHCEAHDPVFTPKLMAHTIARVKEGMPEIEKKIARRSGPEAAAAYRRAKLAELKVNARIHTGQPWSALDEDGKARLLRALDETEASPFYHVILPEGEKGDLVRKANGSPARLGWTSFDIIGDAIALMRDGSVEQISQRLGGYHKVRSFFNNISDPWDQNSVTIDTHAIAAALLIPVTSNSDEVKTAMDRPEDSRLGIRGTNPIYAEAYFRLAAELGLLPRELQSIVWEAGRGLFVWTAKRHGLPKTIRRLWQQFRSGKLDEEQLRGEILAASGSVRPPAWADTPARVAVDEGRLREGDVQPLRPAVSARRGDGRARAEGAPRRNTALPDGLVIPRGGPTELAQAAIAAPQTGAFARLLATIAAQGAGFTYSVTDDTSPTVGMALSLFPAAGVVFPATELSIERLADFVTANTALLAEPGNHLGAWHNDEDGRIYLDVSRVVETDEEAQALGREHDQIAYTNLATVETVKIVYPKGWQHGAHWQGPGGPHAVEGADLGPATGEAVREAEREGGDRGRAGAGRAAPGGAVVYAQVPAGADVPTGLRPAARRAAVRSRLGRLSRSGVRPYVGRGRGRTAEARGVVQLFEPALPFVQAFGEIAYPTPTILELDPATQAARFREALRASKAVSPIGPQVTLADEADYQTMRLFITEDGRSGFALKSDGDIVSVFSGGGGVLHALVALAVQEGGTKLDCFNTMLPRLYSVNGFRIVARDAWNDAYTPEGWDFKAMARFNNGRPDVVYMEYDEASLQQPGEQTFFQLADRQETTHEWTYSRLRRSVELATLAKASGAQWKATIQNSKIGINRDEFLFARLADLDDATVYTKQEVLDYLATNSLQVAWAVYGDPAATGRDLERITETIYDDLVAHAYDDISENGEIEEATWRTEETPDGEWEAVIGGERYGPFETEAEAETAAEEEVTKAYDAAVAAAAVDRVSWGTAEAMAEEIAELFSIRREASFDEYQWRGAQAVPGTYREVVLHAPQFGTTGFRALSAEENRFLRLDYSSALMDLRSSAAGESDEAFGQIVTKMIDRLLVAHSYQTDPVKRYRVTRAIDILRKLLLSGNYAWRSAGWKDGHAQYADTENPIVRLRFSERTLADGRTGLFLEEVQAPSEVNFAKMPPLLQKQWRDIGFKWALAHAVERGLSFVAWTTGDVQRKRYRLTQAVDKITWQPTPEFSDDWAEGGRTSLTIAFKAPTTDPRSAHVVQVTVDEQGKVINVFADQRIRDAANAWPGRHLAEVLGKAMAERIMANASDDLRGVDLEIGGEGLAKLYDVDFVNVVNHLPAVKKAGVRVAPIPVVSDVLEMPAPARGGRAKRARPPSIVTVDMPGVEITPALAESVAAGQALFQTAPEGPRGRLTIGGDRRVNIEFLRNANLSTFLHETGHLYLEVLGDIAGELRLREPSTLTAGQAGVVRDYETILRWFGVVDRGAIQVEHHEMFARGFEAYLREGRAPSITLRRAFARFKAWLLALYKTDGQLRVIVSPEVSEVFDRLLASDSAIAEARAEARVDPLFMTAEDAGMTPSQFAAYQKAVMLAHDAARDSLEARLMQEMRRARSTQQKARRAAIEQQVRLELSERPIYRALAALQRGERPDGSALGEPIKLSRQAIVAKWGEARLKTLPLPWVYSVEGGVDPDAVAELWGFSSGDELLTQLAEAPKLDAAVAQETNLRAEAEFGDLQSDGSLRELARRAVQENGYDTILAAELRALARKVRETRPMVREAEQRVRAEEREAAAEEVAAVRASTRARGQAAAAERAGALADVRRVIPTELVRSVAVDRIARMRVRDVKPHEFWAAARRAGQLALEAAIKRNYAVAYEQKQRQRLAVELYREAHRTLDEVAGILRFARRLGETPARARLGKAGQSYLDQVDAILNKFEFARVSTKALDRRASLVAWLQEREDEGLPVDGIPADVIEAARAVNYRELPVEQLRSIRDTLRQIEHLARLKNTLLRNRDTRAFKTLRDEVVTSVEAQGGTKPLPIEFRQADERKHTIAEWFASHKKIAILARALDGHLDNGPVWRAIIRPINEAADAEQERRRTEGTKLAAIVKQHYPGRELGRWNSKRFIRAIGRSLSKEGCLAVALNWGNETSRQRLLNDPRRQWDEVKVQAILETLDRRDWQFVQAVWDYVDTFWPEVAEKQRRVTGLAPEKVEALEVQTRFGTFRGGYYPLAYDSRMAGRAGQVVAASEAKLQVQAAYVRTTTRRGHVETRLQHVELPVRLDLGVLFAHLDQVIHDLTHHETLIDVSRMLRDRAVSKAIVDTAGDAVYRQFTTALSDIATGGRVGQNILDRAATFMKTGTQIAQLGFNFWTAVQQPLGVFNGMSRVGPVWVLRGMKRWLVDAAKMENTAKWVQERSLMMRSRSTTATQDLSDLRVTLSQANSWFDRLLRTVSADHVTRQQIVDAFLWHIGLAQKVADMPTWLGAYEKALATGTTTDEETAARLADQAVLDSQGGGQIKDLSQLQRGGPIARLFMTFYSYGSTLYNATADAYGKTSVKNPLSIARFLGDLSLLYFFPALGTVLASHLLGRTGDEDDDEAGFVAEIGEEMLGTALNTMVLVRELGLIRYSGGEARGWAGPSGARAISLVYRLAAQAQQGEFDEGLWKALNAVAGVLFRYPAAQVQRTVDGWVALQEGESENPAALLVGPTRAR